MKNILYDTFFKRIFISDIGIKYMSLIISELYNLNYNDIVNNIIVINNEHIRDDINIKSSMSDIEQGIEQGIERGQEKKQFDIAKILKKRNFSNKDIVDITNLTEEQVINL